jgi:hypothetical protein
MKTDAYLNRGDLAPMIQLEHFLPVFCNETEPDMPSSIPTGNGTGVVLGSVEGWAGCPTLSDD